MDFRKKRNLKEYIYNHENKHRTKELELYKQVEKLRKKVEKELVATGDIGGEILSNGKCYIKYNKGDKEKVESNIEITKLNREIKKYQDLEQKIECWYIDSYYVETIYEEADNF